MSERVFTPTGLDALPPVEMARKAEHVGVAKADMSTADTFALSLLAGAFIALGAIFATTVTAGGSDVPFGVLRLVGGLAFSLGLILVIVAGAELFTGNNLIVMAWASRRVTKARRSSGTGRIVYVGNFVGAFATALILYASKQYEFGHGAVGVQAPCDRRGQDRPRLRPGGRARGVLQRARLPGGLALLQRAHDDGQDPLDLFRRSAAFVAAGFEHCVANMFFIPMGLLARDQSDEAFVSSQPSASRTISDLTLGAIRSSATSFR